MGHRNHRYDVALGIAGLVLLLASLVGSKVSQAAPSAGAAVDHAWRRAQEAGVYHFSTEIVQTTYPAPAVTNAGRRSQTERLYLEGRVNTPAHQMALTLRPEGGNVLSRQDSFEIRVDGNQAYGRKPGGEWQEIQDFSGAFAPAGDLLAYLAGAENVRPAEVGQASGLTRYVYDVDGPAFAAYVRDQLEQYLVKQGELPPSIRLESADLYRDVKGDGEVWLTADDLPARLAVDLTYPPEANGERVEAHITTDFFGFPEATSGVLQRKLETFLPQQAPGAWQKLTQMLGMALGTAGFLVILVSRWRSRALYTAVVLVLILSMVVAPVVNNVKAGAFFDRQAAQRAEQEAEQAAQTEVERTQAEVEGPAWDPQQDPLAQQKPAPREIDVPRANAEEDPGAVTSELCTSEEKSTDTDEDGLTDCDERTRYLTDIHNDDTDGDTLLDSWEVLRLGTLPTEDIGADSDGDGIGDGLEVVGFAYRSKTWYSDPNSADTDGDGRPDGIECPERVNTNAETPIDPSTPCVDTDEDSVPDIFDHDSDGDGVPDRIDLSPLTARGLASPFNRMTPFQLLVENLQARPDGQGGYFPTMVDFQIRPENPEHLTYALNVLDWPSGDEMGQIQRRAGNDSTLADVMPAEEGSGDPRMANGDMRLIPMVEIEMSGAHLPFSMTTARTTLGWTNNFDVELTLTQQANGIEVHLSNAPDGGPTYGFQVYEGICGDLGAPVGQRFTLSPASITDVRNDLGHLVEIADGEHVILADDGPDDDNVRSCVQIGDLPNGASSTQMIDPEPLKTYGMSVRDKDNDGTVLVYAPLNVVPDETGGGRTAFSARIFYQPQADNLGDVAQQVRVVWLVQALTDWCKPAPADLSEEETEDWCDSAENWSLDNPQIVHTYYEDWYLTGLSVREDHGLNVAVAWEDPSMETAEERQWESGLWAMARGLNRAFVSGRDQDEDGMRDIGVTTETAGLTLSESTIAQRFNAPLDPSVTVTDRFGIPLTATFGVETLTYSNQDEIAHVMMTESDRILEDTFGDYPEATPTLLFAREELYRSAGLGDLTSEDRTVTLDFDEQAVNVLAALSWSPYRFREGSWENYPLNEYWEHLGSVLGEKFEPGTTLSAEMQADVITGQIYMARAYYLTLNQGQVNHVQINNTPLGSQGPNDATLAADLTFTVSAFLVQMLVDQLVEDLFGEGQFGNSGTTQGTSPTGRIAQARHFLAQLGRGIKTGVSKLPPMLTRVRTTLTTRAGLGAAGGVGALLGVAAALVTCLALGGVVEAAVTIEVIVNTVIAATMIYALVTTFRSLLRPQAQAATGAATTAGSAVGNVVRRVSRYVRPMSRASMVCGLVGLIIGVMVAFAGMLATIIAGDHKGFSLAANAAFAQAVAYSVVAVLMFSISLIPVVGQIIAAVIAAIDALIAAACSIGSAIAGEDVSKRPGGWICQGISGTAAELLKQLYYSATVLVDLDDEERLTFGPFDYALPTPELGLSASNAVVYSAELTNTIEMVSIVAAGDELKEEWESGQIPIPVDWKSMSYWWQYKDENVKKSTFDYRWQTEEEDLEGLEFKSMSDEWQPTGEAHTFSIQANPTSAPIPLGPAGLNQRPTLYLSEGHVLPVQECFAFPNGPQCALMPLVPYACLVPVCYVRHKEGTSHLDLGDRFIVDIFPATLDAFYQPTAKNGGYSPAWAQVGTEASGGTARFPVQADFDGDGLLAQVKGGADPDDGQWDNDGDGLNDAFEYQQGTDPMMYDTDQDGLNDAEELRAGTDPRRKDSDGDGLTDGEELDGWEIVYAFDENGEPMRTRVTADPLSVDADEDGLTDFKEKTYGFSPECPSDPTVLEMASEAREGDAPRLLLRFNEAAGAETFADGSGYGKTATCAEGAGCPTSTDGRYASGLHFDGEDALRVPHSELNALRNDLTLAAWVRPGHVSGRQTLIGTAFTESGNGFMLSLTTNNYLEFYTYGIPTYRLDDVSLPADQWSHVAVVMGGDNRVTFYVDGTARGTQNQNAPAPSDPDDDLIIGASTLLEEPRLKNFFSGDLDEVAVFDRALGADEVAVLADARYNPNDRVVQPGATMAYTATLTNKLYDRYAQGLHSVSAVQGGALSQTPPPETFVLEPIEDSTLAGEVRVAETATSGAFTLTQQANAQVTDWRETSNFAELWLMLNEPAGATAFTDHSGTIPPRDATCAGACPTAHAPGYFDYALSFDGSQFLTLDTPERLGLQESSFSVSAWIKGSDFPRSGGAADDRAIMGTAGNQAEALQLVVRDRQPTMSFNGQTLRADTTLATGTWYHVVFRYDADQGEQTIYVNGDLQGTQTGVTPFSGAGAVYLGRARDGYGFQGTIDDVRTFRRALSLEEIRALYNRPVLRYQFETDNPTGTQIAFDASGFGNAAQCDPMKCPGSIRGVYGQHAAHFGGTDFYNVSGTPSLNLGEGHFTVAAWIWPDALSSDADSPQGILGRYWGVSDTGVEGGGGIVPIRKNSYPSLFNVGGKLRFGYGTGEAWVTRTTSDTVLTENHWNHVVLSFGPEYAGDGSTLEGYRAVLYVNNEVRADWTMGDAPPFGAETHFYVGRASDQARIYIDRFRVIEQADESRHCEIRIEREGHKIGEWGDLDTDEERDVDHAYIFSESSTLRAWEVDDGFEAGHNYGDDPLCELNASNCEGKGYTATTNDDSRDYKRLDWQGDDKSSNDGLNHEDNTRIKITLGAPGTRAFTNPSVPFQGRMDELTMYKRPLSAREVQELYFSASMAMRLPFDDAPGSETFQDTVDVSMQGGAYCTGADAGDGTCPTAGINGRENQAVRFDGVNDVVQTDLRLDQSAISGGATLAVWVRPRSTSAGVHNVIRSQGYGWSLVRMGDEWQVYDGRDSAETNAPVDVGQWQHLAAVFDPQAGLTLYKNGVAVNGTPVPIYHTDDVSSLTLGGGFDGALDDARVFNRQLTAEDVDTLYHQVPVFQLHLDEPHGGAPPFRDAAGGLEATCDAATCPKAGLNGQVELAVGFSLDADAATAPLTFDHIPALEVPAFTIGAWVLPTTRKNTRQVLVKNGSNATLTIPPDAMHAAVSFWHDGVEHSLNSTVPLVMNQWNHVMGTYDGERLRIYVNGYPQGETTTSQTPTHNGAPLQIGSETFAGRLDEVTLYSRALAATEVRDIFHYQGKLVETHNATWITVDDEPPVSVLRSYSPARPYITPEGVALHVEARDATSSVSMLELGVSAYGHPPGYTAAPRCTDAAEAPVGTASAVSAWCPYFNPADEGTYLLTTRATDRTGHRETPTRTYPLHVDAGPPEITMALPDDHLIAATRHPTRQGYWRVRLSGGIVDPAIKGGAPGSGVDTESVAVTLLGPEGDPLGAGRQPAAIGGGTWSLNYVFGGARPTGRYTITVTAADRLGNASSAEAPIDLHLDATAPTADLDVRDGVEMNGEQPFEGQVSELPLPKDTLLALRFEEETSGATTFYDSSGDQRHGACLSFMCPAVGADGRSGHAANFDGRQTTVYLPPMRAAGINGLSNDLSVAAWIKPRSPGGIQRIVAADRASSLDDGFAFGLSDNHLHLETFGVHNYTLDAVDVQAGVWTHVAAVMDAQNDVTFYVNGVARGTVSHNRPANADSDDRFLIGSGRLGGSADTFNGILDEVVVVGRALGADEIRQLAQQHTFGVTEVDAAFRPAMPGSPFRNTPNSPALALQLPLDDTPGASDVDRVTFVELAGKGATATCAGSACPDLNAPGHSGSAVRFDGREDTIALHNVGDLTTATAAAWVKRSGKTGGRETVLAYKEQEDCGFVLALDGADAHPYAAFNIDGTWATVADAGAVPVGTWAHLAVSYDGRTLRLYRDGEPIAETGASGAIAPCAAGSALGSNPAGNGDLLAGALDDVHLYSRALSAAEIETLYRGSAPLLALNFDAGQGWATDGAALVDASAWDHAVSLHTGGPFNTAVAGQVGAHALTFDGINDYVAVAADPSLALDRETPAFTQAAWVYVNPQDSGETSAKLYPIFSSAAYDTPEAQYPFLQVIERDRLVVGFGDGAALHTFTTDAVLTPETWQHVAGVFDGQTYTVYVDGAPIAETDRFAGLHPTDAHRFDVGRGARAEDLGCAAFEEVTLTGETWEQQWRVRYQGETIYKSPVYPTAGRTYPIPLQAAFCGPASFEIEARYWDAASGWNWASLGTFDLTPAPGVRSHTFTAGGRAGTLTWRTTTPQNDLRYFRGQLDAVHLYPRALSAPDVQRLTQGGWQPADLAESGDDVDVTSWQAQTPAGLEGSYEVDVRGQDRAGHLDLTGLSQRLWSGELDTRAPRVAITRTVAGNRYRYETVAEDYNLVHEGFSSPCGAGVGEAEPFNASWYRALVGPTASSGERLYRLTAACETPTTGLFQTGVWAGQPWITGQPAVVTGTGETTAYVPAGRLWQVDVSDPARPRLADIYPSVQDARSVALDETHAYVSEGTRGLSVLPLNDPSAPAARYNTPGEAADAALTGNHVVVADGSGGLRVLDVSDPDNPVEIGHLRTEDTTRGVAVSAMSIPTTTEGAGRALPAPILTEPSEEASLRNRPAELSSIDPNVRYVQTAILKEQAAANAAPVASAPQADMSSGTARPVLQLRTRDITELLTSDGVSGTGVAISGDTVAVGASAADIGANVDQGAVYLFKRNHGGADTWGEVARITAEDGAAYDRFGASVALHGDVLIVGAPAEVCEEGDVYVFYRNHGGADAWGQFAKLEPPRPGDFTCRFGTSVAFDGQVLAVGAVNEAGEAFDDGAVYIFYRNKQIAYSRGTVDGVYHKPDVWDRVNATLTDGTTRGGGEFGKALAIDGDILAVGAPGVDCTSNNPPVCSGARVMLFHRRANGVEWDKVATLQLDDYQMNDRFGEFVDLDGDTLAAGSDWGRYVTLFRRNAGGEDNWGAVRSLTVDLDANEAGSHFALSLHGDTLAAGGWYPYAYSDWSELALYAHNQGGPEQWGLVQSYTNSVYSGVGIALTGDTLVVNTDSGAHLLARDGNKWDRRDILTDTAGAAGDRFGTATALSGDVLAVGVPDADSGGLVDNGAVYVFSRSWDLGDAWESLTTFTGTVAGARFGAAVNFNGEVLAIGAPGANSGQGAVSLHYRNQSGRDQWQRLLTVTASDGAAGDSFGSAMGFNVNTLVVGAPSADNGQGKAYVYVRHSIDPDTWEELEILTATDGLAGDGFGSAVSLRPNRCAVGAPNAGSGKVYVFAYRSQYSPDWYEIKTLSAGATGDGFGSALALSPNAAALAVGAPRFDSSETEEGALYLFERNYDPAQPTVPVSDTWGRRLRIQAPVGTAGGHFGTDLVLGSDLLLAGAPGTGNGEVWAFQRNANGADAWGIFAQIAAENGAAGDSFGTTLDYDVRTGALAVGAPDRDTGTTVDLGAAYAYQWVWLRAEDDTYTLEEDTRLAVNAPGLLDNDACGSESCFVHALVSSPATGTLALNVDGSFLYTPAVNHNGIVTFTYRMREISDDELLMGVDHEPPLSDLATVTLTVTPVNDWPLAAHDAYTLTEDTPLYNAAPGLLTNDTEIDGDPLTAVLLDAPDHGPLTLGSDGSFTYTPTLEYSGPDSFSYRADDGSAAGTLAYWSLDEGSGSTVYDLTGNGHTGILINAPTFTHTVPPSTTFVNANALSFNGSDAYGNLGTLPSSAGSPARTVCVWTKAKSTSGTRSALDYGAMELWRDGTTLYADSARNTDLSVPGFWDTNWHHLCVTYDGATARLFADGVQRAAAARSWDLDPQTAYLGRSGAPHDPALYWAGLLDDARIYDRALERWEIAALAAGDYHLDLAHVSLTITPVNDPPVAHADVYTPTEDTVLTIAAPGVLGNDQDVENDPLTATLVMTPTHGAFAFSADGGFQYTPDPDFDGSDAFTYRANDGELDSNPVTVTLNVAPVNDAPLAQDDAYTTPEDTLLNVPAPGVLTNDSDADGDTLQATVIQSPTMGALTLAGNGSLLYEPPLEYSGVTTFTYQASDGELHDLATVTITVPAVNDPPVARDDAYTTDMDIPLVVGAPGLLGNDSDAEGATLQASLTTPPAHGTADVALDGAFIYTPTLSFFGVDTFDYQASDGTISTTAAVSLTVNGPPTAGDAAVFTQEDTTTTLRLIPDHTSDPESDTLHVTAVGTPVTGTTALSGTTGVRYTPAPDFTGVEIFTYTVADPRGLTASARITVTVGGVNDPPVAVDDQVKIAEDHAVRISVLDNDHDLEATPQLVGITTPAQGSAEIVGRDVRYTPLPDFYGADGFTYTISDGVLTATARVTITVTSVNDLPTLDPLADIALEPGAGEQVVALSGIDTGADNEPQPLDVTAASSNPSLIADPTITYDGASTTGNLRFTPSAGVTGTATVSVTVSDGLSETLRAFNVTVWDATGPFAYVAAGGVGMLVIDLSRPETPRKIATVPTPDAAQDVTLAGDTAYVAAGAAGLMVVDVSTPIQPILLAVVATPGFAGSASVVEDQVFIADGYTGVALVDASDPATPTLASSSDTPGYANRLTAVGHTLYVADSNGGLRTFNTEVPPGRATACDRAGNCTTVEATVLQTLDATAEARSVPTTGVRILNAPPVLMDTTPLTVTGKAFAESASLQALTLTLGSSTLFTQTWASGTVSATIWNALWDPTGLSDGPKKLHAALRTWDGTQVSDTLTVTLDTQPPQVAVATTVLTHTHYRADGAMILEGWVVDAGGVTQVELLSDDESHQATVEGQVWKVPWYLPTDALPDGETYTVTVRATDIAGRVKHITPTLRVDIAPPSSPTLTLRSGETVLAPGTIVRELSPTLTLDWTASQDGSTVITPGGSGSVTYDVEWLATAGNTQTVVTGTPGTVRTATYTPPEAAEIAVRVGARDLYGQTRWERFGPVYVDGPRTPDYVGWRGASPYRGWMESGCTLLGVDRRIKRDALDTGTLNDDQRLYGTWNADALRLAWTGADWGPSATESGDGDLFLYLDTMPGGTTTTFDPYGVATRTLHLPGVTPTGTENAMNADAMVWVRDAETALLLRWQDAEGRWQIQGPLSDAEYQYDAEVNGGQTNLTLPFERIGLAAGGSLDLVAFAAEEGSLDLWATLPNANPLSSGRVVETAAFEDGDARFALLHRYHWDCVSAGICPNGSDGTSPAYPDTEVQAQLSATPQGVAYSLLDSDLFWLWEQLAGDKPADVSSFFQMMSTDHPQVGGNQTMTYTLRTRNTGTEPAAGLYAKVSAHYALHLTPGFSDRQIPLGDLAPGEEIRFSFRAGVNLTRSPEPWAAVTVELYDDAYPDSGPPLERLWLDHQVDRAAPAFVGITQPAYVLGAGPNRVQGYSYDASGVPMLSLNLDDGTSLDCPDTTPTDGTWTCTLDASGYQDGDVITARAEAEDAFGQRSDPSAPRHWIVDTTPPRATLTTPAGTTLPVVAETLQLAGRLTDTYGLAGAEVCLAGACTPATVRLSGAETERVVTDAPDAPLFISGGACSTGSGLARTFRVTDSFTLGQVGVGFSAAHPRRDDLDVTLVAPSGTSVGLLTDDGLSGTNFQHYNVWLEDTANGPYASRADDTAEATFTRRARPASPLAAFIGEESAGDWQLIICDRHPSTDDGTYLGSRLSLVPSAAAQAARTGTWSHTFHPEETLDYEVRGLHVVGVDLAGNRTTDPLNVDVIVDNVAPVLTATHIITRTPFTPSLQVLAGTLADGSLDAGTEDLRLSVVVEGPGGTYADSAAREGTSWQYTLHPSVPGTYQLSVTAYDTAGNATTAGPFTVNVKPWRQIYMPFVARRFIEAPDLVVNHIDAGPQGVQVVIANRGNTPAVDDFWVDLYVDPATRPFEVNETWNWVGTQGAVWGVTTPLAAGAALTLTVGDRFYHTGYSQLHWPLPPTATLYAHVDSAGDPTYGGVREDHEILEEGYNNIAMTTIRTETTIYSHALGPITLWEVQDPGLPVRR